MLSHPKMSHWATILKSTAANLSRIQATQLGSLAYIVLHDKSVESSPEPPQGVMELEDSDRNRFVLDATTTAFLNDDFSVSNGCGSTAGGPGSPRTAGKAGNAKVALGRPSRGKVWLGHRWLVLPALGDGWFGSKTGPMLCVCTSRTERVAVTYLLVIISHRSGECSERLSILVTTENRPNSLPPCRSVIARSTVHSSDASVERMCMLIWAIVLFSVYVMIGQCITSQRLNLEY